ncbi:hypothetical protein [Propioniciclava tarda]|uniref:Uncharacterized protein n=1 Tax=Propioniciclava tarda TaxID=433330 RepID=A0A4Q9KMQ0_PROTD|nr:hypothetical protein [Propioniciclava tarda]TBT95694.1 hypothetical protein ET996_04420 [Propioniciclava tarda]
MSTSTVITYINRAVERYRERGRTVGNISDAIREATADGFLDLPGAALEKTTSKAWFSFQDQETPCCNRSRTPKPRADRWRRAWPGRFLR